MWGSFEGGRGDTTVFLSPLLGGKVTSVSTGLLYHRTLLGSYHCIAVHSCRCYASELHLET